MPRLRGQLGLVRIKETSFFKAVLFVKELYVDPLNRVIGDLLQQSIDLQFSSSNLTVWSDARGELSLRMDYRCCVPVSVF